MSIKMSEEGEFKSWICVHLSVKNSRLIFDPAKEV